MRSATRALIGVAGVLLLLTALAIFGYAVAAGRSVTDLGVLLAVSLIIAAVLLLTRYASWEQQMHCPQCGADMPRDATACPRCGYSSEAATWAAFGSLKVQ